MPPWQILSGLPARQINTPLQEQCECYMGVDTIVTLAKRASALSAYVEVLNLGKRARALSRSIF